MREVPHKEEQKALKEFIKGLRKRGWKRVEIEAAESGWEWAFDVGSDQPHLDADAAGDLADCVIDGRKYSRGAIADCVYEGINAARALQESPESKQKREDEKAKRREEVRQAIEKGRAR